MGPRHTPMPPPPPELPGTPREVLEQLLLEPVSNPPCHVAFSGGRDSSAILATATHVARQHDLPDPIPLTARLEEHPRTWETDWQRVTIDHLGIEEWRIVPVTDQLDALSPIAVKALRRHGLFWPSQSHSMLLFAEHAGAGSLLTGGGGDEVFTPWSGRRPPLRRILRGRSPLSAAKWTAYWALPRKLRGRVDRARRQLRLPWMRPEAEAEILRRRTEIAKGRTRGWSDVLEYMLESRYLELVRGVLDTFAADAGVRLHEPFYDSRFVRAMARSAPRSGHPTRADALQAVFGDLLPAEIWQRGTKAVFTEVAWGPQARAFAESWDGTGLDETLVDPDRLREEWSKPRPDARTLTSLRLAWLAAQRSA
jgi:asparagine synthetase B (glutamine-hydrolysing)